MMINLRSRKTNKLYSKDILEIDLDLSIIEDENGYYVKINKDYILDEIFENEEEAENSLRTIALARNNLENELRQYL